MKVLLSESDAMRRQLTASALEERGHRTLAVSSWREALEAFDVERFDVALLDVQMNGCEVIRKVRAREHGTDTHALIIALIAADQKGERERLIELGADDCISSPVCMPDLFAALDRVEGRKTEPTDTIPTEARPECALDIKAALERVEGDRDLLDELLALFAEECQSSIKGIREAFDSRDARVLERLAHTVKGSAANLGANDLSKAASAVEKKARAEEMDNVAEEVAALERQVERLMPELESLVRKATR